MKQTPTEISSELEKNLILSSCINTQVRELINEIEFYSSNNPGANPRGLKVKEALITGFAIDPRYPCIDFQARPMNWKYLAGELAWYLYQNRNISLINKFSSFWKNIADEDNKVNSNYGNILLKNRPTTTQVAWVVNSLKKDKDTRQAVAFVGGKDYQYEGNKDFVCTLYANFFIRDNQLHMKVQMRSNDIVYGMQYDVPWFSTLHQNILYELQETYPDLKLGKYFHFSDNSHYYERHFDLIDEIKKEEIKPGPKLILKKPLWLSNDKGKTELTPVAHEFLKSVSNKLEDMETMSQDDWKEVLKEIFEITENQD